jgi:hypothetical protein
VDSPVKYNAEGKHATIYEGNMAIKREKEAKFCLKNTHAILQKSRRLAIFGTWSSGNSWDTDDTDWSG